MINESKLKILDDLILSARHSFSPHQLIATAHIPRKIQELLHDRTGETLTAGDVQTGWIPTIAASISEASRNEMYLIHGEELSKQLTVPILRTFDRDGAQLYIGLRQNTQGTAPLVISWVGTALSAPVRWSPVEPRALSKGGGPIDLHTTTAPESPYDIGYELSKHLDTPQLRAWLYGQINQNASRSAGCPIFYNGRPALAIPVNKGDGNETYSYAAIIEKPFGDQLVCGKVMPAYAVYPYARAYGELDMQPFWIAQPWLNMLSECEEGAEDMDVVSVEGS